MIYLILFMLTIYIFMQFYFSLRVIKRRQSSIEVVITITRTIFQIVFAIWLILFTVLGYLGNIHF